MATALEATVQDISVKGTFDHATNVHETIVHETIDMVELAQESICDTLKVRGRILETRSKSTRGQKNEPFCCLTLYFFFFKYHGLRTYFLRKYEYVNFMPKKMIIPIV